MTYTTSWYGIIEQLARRWPCVTLARVGPERFLLERWLTVTGTELYWVSGT
jgi:hypothetical protein